MRTQAERAQDLGAKGAPLSLPGPSGASPPSPSGDAVFDLHPQAAENKTFGLRPSGAGVWP